MARFNATEVDNYGSSGGAGFFSLKDDKDTAQVRFLYNTEADIEACSVHEVYIGDKRRYVDCLRSYKDPIDVCPFCANKEPLKVKLFVPMYNVDTEKVVVWDRGKKFINKIRGIASRYSSQTTPLCAHIFEIERNGKKGDQATTYEIYEQDKDSTVLDDLPEFEEAMNGIVLEKTAEEMEYFLKHKEFPSSGASSDEADERPRRRASEDDYEQPVRRRTPRREI